MNRERLTTVLRKFIAQELQRGDGDIRPLTMMDFRLGIRSVRLTEFRDWSNHDLDLMEVHAARFEDNALLEHALQLPADSETAPCAASVSSMCSPSPFAWT
jgi:hypothetical protein